ncbi:MAG: multidrug effflux MFS transporter [Pseudomonadota bacterium]
MSTPSTSVTAASFALMATLLGLFSMLSLTATDMYLPALPSMVLDLGTTEARAQATLVIFFAGLSLSQLVVGPLSDRFGRRPVILGGTALFVVSSVACALAPTVEVLLAARLFQAFAAGALAVLPRSITMDSYRGVEATQLIGIVTIVTAASPMLAPLAGSFVLLQGDWRTIFWVLSALAVATLVFAASALPETTTRRKASVREIGQQAATLLRAPSFRGPALITAMAFVCFAMLITTAPFVYIEEYGLTPTQFGLAFGTNAFGFVIAAGGGGALAEKLGTLRTLQIGKAVYLGASVAMLLAALAITPPLWLVIGGMSVVLFGLGLVLPTGTVLALEEFTESAGLASSLLGSIQMLTGAVAVGILTALFPNTLLLLVGAIAASALAAALLRARPA